MMNLEILNMILKNINNIFYLKEKIKEDNL